jgi:Xaa-Pro aminopeptidase
LLTATDRFEEVERKQQRVAEFLERQELDALLLQDRDHFAWFTCGGESTSFLPAPPAALFLTADARVAVADNVSSPMLFERELAGLGFQLKERRWHEDERRLLDDLCRRRRVGSDRPGVGTRDVSAELALLRLPLSPEERTRLKELGRDVAHAVEATARNITPGTTEAEAAGQIAHRLIRREVTPEGLQAVSDQHRRRFRTQGFTPSPIQHFCTLAAVGRRDGLYAACARTVCFGEIPDDLAEAHNAVTLVQATGLFFSQAEWTLDEVWKRVARIYEKTGHPGEWELAPQAEVTGYRACEQTVRPGDPYRLLAGSPVVWHPSVGPATACDTMLVGEGGGEIVTPMETWPRLRVRVKNATFSRPGILRVLVNQTEDEIPDINDSNDSLAWFSADSSITQTVPE